MLLGFPLKGKQWLTMLELKLGYLGFAPKPKAGIRLSESYSKRMRDTASIAIW